MLRMPSSKPQLPPVLAQLLHVGERDALAPVVHGLRVRPPRPSQTVPKVRGLGIGDPDLEVVDLHMGIAS